MMFKPITPIPNLKLGQAEVKEGGYSIPNCFSFL